MPKTKKRGKGGNRAEKEKPLLSVQGILRLEKSFITAQHEGAQTMTVKKSDDAEAEVVKLVPGQSEHDLVQYKAGYDVGPSNPFPETETEAGILEAQKVVDDRREAFEEMKRQSEAEKAERKMKFEQQEREKRRRLGLMPDVPPGTEDEAAEKAEADKQEQVFNPEDPSHYVLPDHLRKDPAFHNDEPLEFGGSNTPPEQAAAKEASAADAPEQVEEDPDGEKEASPPEKDVDGQETQEFPEAMLPKMKPLPEATSSSSGTSSQEPTVEKDVAGMALKVAQEMEEKRKREARERLMAAERGEKDAGDAEVTVEEDHDTIIYSLDELTKMTEEAAGTAAATQGPDLSQRNIEEVVKQQREQDARTLLSGYWQFVRENPQDFNGWCYLIQHVENMDDLDEVRAVYNAFLPLFPYCYAYWQRYAEVEKKHENWQRSLAILHRGLEAIPLSVDLWVSYLELYRRMYREHEDFAGLFRTQCERAVQAAGLEYKSDPLWERYVEWEAEQKELAWITGIYKRLVCIPTRLYNKHWDNFIAHIRDHHPRDILEYEDYEELRKVTCRELELTYRPDPIIQPSKQREVVMPEDKLKAGMKERIVASVVADHERCEEEVDVRLRFEEKIKRTYFHVKPLDLKQLRNWESYLDFEVSQGDHERAVVLFERCLIPCAQYEQFWAKYAGYLESHHKRESDPKRRKKGAAGEKDASVKVSPLKKARFAFSTGMTKVDEIREKRCTWTLRGWLGKDKDGNEVMMAQEIHKEKERKAENEEKKEESSSKEAKETAEGEQIESMKDPVEEDAAAAEALEEEEANGGEGEEEKKEEVDEQDVVDREMSDVTKSHQVEVSAESGRKWRDAVRDVFKRACIVHCPRKAMIKLRWAAFEEEAGEAARAKEILTELNRQFPLLLECCVQLIDLERRTGDVARADELYRALLKKIPQNRRSVKTWVSLKYARFQFKVRGLPDEALATLRAALKKERGDPRIYAQIVDICYQRHPVDVSGVTAAIELAVRSPALTSMQKLDFVKRKAEFMQEFGGVAKCREAAEQLKTRRAECAADLKVEAKRKKELEREEQKLKELEAIKARVRAGANMKAKLAEQEGRLMCTSCQSAMYPDAEGVYEFEKGYSGRRPAAAGQGGGGAAGEVSAVDEDGVVDLMDWMIPEEQEEQIKKKLEEKTRYKEVAPTWELNMETYGYGKRQKMTDPDYEHVESAKFKEYERLESKGYDDNLKDPDHDKIKNIQAPGLGAPPKGSRQQSSEKKYTSSDYVIPPKVPQLHIGPAVGPAVPGRDDGDGFGGGGRGGVPGSRNDAQNFVFELPPELANPQRSPCVNVPEWFVKEGGELCLSDTANGLSILRYWPKFLSEKGNGLMFSRLRRYCKWHQKQVKIGGEWKYETRLVAWYGPCDYVYSGLNLDKNLNWAPELLDLLHRLIAMTRHEYNSCFLNLYRHGHDMCGWHSDVHPQLGRNPPVASVSLGTVRVFEFRKKRGPPNFIRFPLFPGSLLVMEGACQEDWLHCLPRDVNCREERINLTFRIMYSIDKR